MGKNKSQMYSFVVGPGQSKDNLLEFLQVYSTYLANEADPMTNVSQPMFSCKKSALHTHV